MKTLAVSRLLETSDVNKSAKLWADSFAAILNARDVKTARVRAMFTATKYFADFGVEFEGNLGDLVKRILVGMYGTRVRVIKMKSDMPENHNYVFRIINPEQGVPSSVSVNRDTSKIFIEFDRT